MPSVIDAKGAVVATPTSRPPSPAGGGKTNAMFRAVFRELSPPRRHGLDPAPRRSVAAAAASPGSKRAPAALARVRSVRRSGATAAWSSDRSRATISFPSIRRSARPPCARRALRSLRERFGDGARDRRLRSDQDARFRGAAVRLAQGREDRRAHARRVRRRANTTASARRCSAYRRNLERVGITHTGALDIKDVLGYARLVLTTAALERARAPSRSAGRKRAQRNGSARRHHRSADHREIDERAPRFSSTPSRCIRARRRRRSVTRSRRSSR
jgi:hypothetical protein